MNIGLFKRKLHFLIFWVIFQMHFLKQILIFKKNPFAQQFLHIKAFIWPWSGYISKISTYPNQPSLCWYSVSEDLLISLYNLLFVPKLRLKTVIMCLKHAQAVWLNIIIKFELDTLLWLFIFSSLSFHTRGLSLWR